MLTYRLGGDRQVESYRNKKRSNRRSDMLWNLIHGALSSEMASTYEDIWSSAWNDGSPAAQDKCVVQRTMALRETLQQFLNEVLNYLAAHPVPERQAFVEPEMWREAVVKHLLCSESALNAIVGKYEVAIDHLCPLHRVREALGH